MTEALSLPAASRRRLRSHFRRGAARLVACASDARLSLWLALGFTLAHVVFWTAILTQLKASQDVHFDVAEAYAWGQTFLLGYGKHPPLSGWIAGVWFRIFPAADWATYALAMAVLGAGMMICWRIALHVVDRRRAFLVLVMLALYPIFNFKGFKYNADLVQLITLPLLVLAYLDAFEKRSVRSGFRLGIACALALLSKYWVLTLIGAVGLAALIHPARLLFLRSPAPWSAIVTLAIVMIPHAIWLSDVNFLPFTYAGATYVMPTRFQSLQLVWSYISHNIAMLAVPVGIAAASLAWSPRWWRLLWKNPAEFFARPWSRKAPPGTAAVSSALNIWIIQIIVAVGPPIGALLFQIYIKTDWGISLFFLTPLALIAIPALRVQRIALVRVAAVWLAATLAVLATVPQIAFYSTARSSDGAPVYGSRAQLARELTDIWHQRFHSRWAVVAAATDLGEPMTFYSSDHPAPLTPDEPWPSGLTSLDEARREGFIGICEVGDWKLEACEAWMKVNAPQAERMVLTTRRFFHGTAGAATAWNVYVVPPGK